MRKKYPRLPNGFGSIRNLGKGHRHKSYIKIHGNRISACFAPSKKAGGKHGSQKVDDHMKHQTVSQLFCLYKNISEQKAEEKRIEHLGEIAVEQSEHQGRQDHGCLFAIRLHMRVRPEAVPRAAEAGPGRCSASAACPWTARLRTFSSCRSAQNPKAAAPRISYNLSGDMLLPEIPDAPKPSGSDTVPESREYSQGSAGPLATCWEDHGSGFLPRISEIR